VKPEADPAPIAPQNIRQETDQPPKKTEKFTPARSWGSPAALSLEDTAPGRRPNGPRKRKSRSNVGDRWRPDNDRSKAPVAYFCQTIGAKSPLPPQGVWQGRGIDSTGWPAEAGEKLTAEVTSRRGRHLNSLLWKIVVSYASGPQTAICAAGLTSVLRLC